MKAVAALAVSVVTFAAATSAAAHAQSSQPAPATIPAAAASEAGKGAALGADTAAAQQAAQQAAQRWLALMDAGQAVEAWDAAAPVLQAAVTRGAWLDVGTSVRAPLGAVKSRRQTSSVFTRTLPGAPDAEYVVIQYATDFSNRAGVVETVVPMRLPDGSWKVTTYRLR